MGRLRGLQGAARKGGLGWSSPLRRRERHHGTGLLPAGAGRGSRARAPQDTGAPALLEQEKGLGVGAASLLPGPQQRRGHHEAPHAELTFVERRVQEGVVEEQAPALSPALGLASHHQFAVAGRLQTFRHKERGQGGSGRAEFPVVGQQGAN